MTFKQSLSVNLALASPLLSRFDLVLVLLDSRNATWDEMVSGFILEGKTPATHAKLMFRRSVEVLDAVVAVCLIESSMQGSALLGGINTLHTSFPENPEKEYRNQVELILTKLALPDILQVELLQLQTADSLLAPPTGDNAQPTRGEAPLLHQLHPNHESTHVPHHEEEHSGLPQSSPSQTSRSEITSSSEEHTQQLNVSAFDLFSDHFTSPTLAQPKAIVNVMDKTCPAGDLHKRPTLSEESSSPEVKITTKTCAQSSASQSTCSPGVRDQTTADVTTLNASTKQKPHAGFRKLRTSMRGLASVHELSTTVPGSLADPCSINSGLLQTARLDSPAQETSREITPRSQTANTEVTASMDNGKAEVMRECPETGSVASSISCTNLIEKLKSFVYTKSATRTSAETLQNDGKDVQNTTFEKATLSDSSSPKLKRKKTS
ncbi:PREDICTED: DNA helicase MCM9-like [Priapulus caudatus]|uniref:DNA helicase MCM9-like n=1 Tax=Priapulus caudatus TaxID=37621 RepID=A0ABM1E7X6_PRICU|nr:PREDICTED: DNA helicase MCM9-like [Priapulus caudatus]